MDIQNISEMGIDIAAGIKRFSGNQEMYIKFLLRFLEDTTFCELEHAIINENYELAFAAAHTLKGTSGNLSIEPLYLSVCELTEMLRENKYDNIQSIFLKVKENYQICRDAIITLK